MPTLKRLIPHGVRRFFYALISIKKSQKFKSRKVPKPESLWGPERV